MFAAIDAIQYYIKSHTVFVARRDRFGFITNSTLSFSTTPSHILLLCSFLLQNTTVAIPSDLLQQVMVKLYVRMV